MHVFPDAIPRERLYYNLASSTGGNIYLAPKPDSPYQLLHFLQDEITLGEMKSGISKVLQPRI